MSAPMTATRKPRISRQVRDRYSLNVFRFSKGAPAFRVSQLNAMALIDKILHRAARLCPQQRNPRVLRQAQRRLVKHVDQKTLGSAFVGRPNATLTDLFLNPAMQISPATVFSLTTPSASPKAFTLHMDGVGSASFNWTATPSPARPAWLNVTPLSGVAGQLITVTLTPPVALDMYTATIRVVADNPQVQNSDQTIPVTLEVVDRIWTSYLPLTAR